jgi:hypothetical protein
LDKKCTPARIVPQRAIFHVIISGVLHFGPEMGVSHLRAAERILANSGSIRHPLPERHPSPDGRRHDRQAR